MRQNKRRVFHVNMLKQFHSPTVVDSSFLVDDTVEASVERELSDEILAWNSQQTGEPKIGAQLSAIQQSDLQKLLDEFTDVLQFKPGRTAVIVEHTVNTRTARTVCLPPYRVPTFDRLN